MYVPASIEKLSHAQILKLLRGQGVRVKHGVGHKLHLSTSQHKKLLSAHMKGKGMVLELDPYQCDACQHMRGEGVMSSLKKAYAGAKKVAHKVGKFYGEHKETLDPYLTMAKSAASKKALSLEEKAKPHLRKHLGKELSSQLGEHVSSAVHHQIHTLGSEYGAPLHYGEVEGSYPSIEPASEIESSLGMGLHRKRGRPRKGGALTLKKIGSTLKNIGSAAISGVKAYAKSPAGRELINKGLQYGTDAALLAAGAGLHRRKMHHMHHMHHRRGGALKKIIRGSALIAAGYS